MNLTHLRYVVEVEKLGSITKAAAALYMGQPNLSKAIKELEREVGIPIFKRSAKGVIPTEKGRQFLQYAKAILIQMDKMENLYKTSSEDEISFSLLVPRASYITYAFTNFLNRIESTSRIDAKFKETNSVDTINGIVECEYNLGIIRYPLAYEGFFVPLIEEKNLISQTIWEYDLVLIMSKESPLAKEKIIDENVLDKYIEILHGDNIAPNISSVYQKKNAEINSHKRHIYVYERGSQFDILSSCPEAYMWVSPMPEKILERYGLIQIVCPSQKRTDKDVLIYQENYRFSDADKMFLEELYKNKKQIIL